MGCCAVTTNRTAHLCNLTDTKNFVNGISLTQSADTNNASSFFSPLISLTVFLSGLSLGSFSFSSSPQESRLNSRRAMTAALKLSFVCCRAMPGGCFSHCDVVGRKRDLLFCRDGFGSKLRRSLKGIVFMCVCVCVFVAPEHCLCVSHRTEPAQSVSIFIFSPSLPLIRLAHTLKRSAQTPNSQCTRDLSMLTVTFAPSAYVSLTWASDSKILVKVGTDLILHHIHK